MIGVSGFSTLNMTNAISLIILSTILTLIAGLVPSRIASRKDPVVALRTE
jgi:putative ABC transport system permease protein